MSRRNQQQAEAAHLPLFTTPYLRSLWAKDFEDFRTSGESSALLTRLTQWAEKDWQKETSAGGTFIEVFFKQIWGYRASGEGPKGEGYTLEQEYAVDGAGERGGVGSADIALGFFGLDSMEPVPQALGEFKDDRSGLDKPQKGRKSKRSPVEQCFDYLREARRGRISTVLPTWGVVTDMNEFRLYVYGNRAQCQRFVLKPVPGDRTPSLLAGDEDAEFQRFVFSRVFHRDWLLSRAGASPLERLLAEQITFEKALEKDFYREYQAFREHLFQTLDDANPSYRREGRLRRLVAITQRLLDRLIFILYCEDMGSELSFPPNALRDLLIEVSTSSFYNELGNDAWFRVKALFETMRDGGPFGSSRIHRFNGGLFAPDSDVDNLSVPNHVFCQKNQGQSEARLLEFKKTLLYFSARYNFGTSDVGGQRTLTLTALGRIFEQSITDLEVMEAQAEGRESLAEIAKRKRDGVYYTPEWVTRLVVEQTIGARLAEIRQELGLDSLAQANEGGGTRASTRKKYLAALDEYESHLKELKVLDPACGSGAFLIQAFQYLYDERVRIASERERITGNPGLFDMHHHMREILSKNLYGVDINAESVEITRLALWLHTALPDRPLASLDQNIRCGNSLIGSDFYWQLGKNEVLFPESERERINVFDWEKAFPVVFDREAPGFDCIIGNPPYVKLQHFRHVYADVAEYLVNARRKDGSPLYESAQTGNFDLYLPFIEKGIELLNSKGKLGYIAPNVWLVNEYGAGLRRKLARGRALDRFIDFKSYQVFDEAITYTALQFFSKASSDRIRCVFAPRGPEEIASLDWEAASSTPYDSLPRDGAPWELMPSDEAALVSRLRATCSTLENSCSQIAVGVQTSADHIYHLEKLGPGRYLHKPKGKASPREVDLEDSIMRPLISGSEAKRYRAPVTDTYILFPYRMNGNRAELIPAAELSQDFPKAWSYLKTHEKELRARERGKFNDDEWYRFGRNQNIDKQHLRKLLVPRLVVRLHATYDIDGSRCLDNVDVNGILVDDDCDAWFLLALLNGSVMNFVWRGTSKPFQNDFRAANKQFIAPLPVPEATHAEKMEVGNQAKRMLDLFSRRDELMRQLSRRLESAQCELDVRTEEWIWADVRSAQSLAGTAPNSLKTAEARVWAKEERERRLAHRLAGLDTMLQAGVRLEVQCDGGELRLLVNGVSAIEGVFLDDQEAPFIAAQWRHKSRSINVTEKFDGKRLVRQLLDLRKTENQALRAQVVDLDAKLQAIESEIEKAEVEMNRLIYRLYKLTPKEIRLIEEASR